MAPTSGHHPFAEGRAQEHPPARRASTRSTAASSFKVRRTASESSRRSGRSSSRRRTCRTSTRSSSATRSSAPACRPPPTARGRTSSPTPSSRFFMHNLGAYRVDRRLKHALYKDVLKAYSCVLLERGYHSLFFPGGTRSRSGGVERKLKLGLVGTGARGVRADGRSAARRSRCSSFRPRSTTCSRSRPRR